MHKKRHSPDDSEDEELASTSLFEPNGDSSQNASDKFAGTVKSLSLINFMSHKNTSLEFGTKINFITGRNGSGKSAILTAIITCLGGKVSFTNRANSFKSLIKEGESVAQITLEIRNSGPDAYKPEELGDIIIVERKISLDGKSGFRIKSADNRIYSSKKDELLAICDHFGIQVDNPLNVLTQDAARQFIGSTSSEDKYMMFLKGTQLSQLTDDHTLIKDAIISCESILKSKQAAIPQLHEEVKAARLKYYSMEKAQELHNNLENLKKQMAWAIVVEEEGRVKMAQDRVEKNQSRLSSIEEKVSEIDVNIKKVDIKVNDAKAQLEGLLEKKPLIQEEINSLQKTSQSKNEEKRKIENEQRHIDSNLKIERNKLENIEKKIREETEKSKKNIEQLKLEINTKIQDKQAELESVKNKKNECSIQAFECESAVASITRSLESKKSQFEELRNKRESLAKSIQQMKSQKSDGLRAFGNSIPQVLQAIERETRWKSKPVGPFGNFVKLKDPVWVDTIESYLGMSLNAFLVENFEDQRILSDILSKLKCESRIFVSPKDEFDFSRGEPSSEHTTVLRVLEFKNPWVMRQLIINNKIEKTILMLNRREADELMKKPPRNVIACFTNEGFQIGHRGGGLSTSTLPPYNGPPRLAQNLEAKLAECQSELDKVEEEFHESEKQVKSLKDEIRNKESERAAFFRERSKIELESKQISSEIALLNQELRDVQPSNITAFEEAKKEIEDQIESLKNQFAPLTEQKIEVSKDIEDLKRQYDDVKIKVTTNESEISSVKGRIDQYEGDKAKFQQNIEFFHSKSKEIQKLIITNQEDLEKAQLLAQEKAEQALEFAGERIPVTKSASSLDRELKQTETQLKLATDELGNTLEECTAILAEKISALKSLKAQMSMSEKLISDLKTSLKVRQRRWNDFCGFIAKRARKNFEWNLTQRGFTGRLEFDHSKKRLVPYVQPSDETRASKGHDRDPKSLSGGEKSYSTISLLLALWEAMGCPIRCLDEYDVFMDAANRAITTRMIVECASHTSGVQHILISPQNLPYVHNNPNCRILKLNDPERNGGINN